MQPIAELPATEDPRTILARDFPSRGPLPIQGGWGYTRESACVIVKDDPVLPAGIPFNGVAVEQEFVARRIWEEMIIFRAPGEKFAGIRWEMKQQRMTVVEGRRYDQLKLHVTALPAERFAALKAEWEPTAVIPTATRQPSWRGATPSWSTGTWSTGSTSRASSR